MNMVRTVGVFMALAALSFVLGFFVLAKLIPGSPKPVAATAFPTSAPADAAEPKDPVGSNSMGSSAEPNKQPSTVAAANPSANSAPVAAPTPGPSLDPAADSSVAANSEAVQKPRKIDDVDPAAPAPTHDEQASTDRPESRSVEGDIHPTVTVRPKRRRHTVAHKTVRPSPDSDDTRDAVGAGKATNDEDNPVPKTRRPRRTRSAPRDEQDSPPADSADDERPVRVRRSDSDTTSTAIYHVHLGAFHTREAASHEVHRARTKGFSTQIVPISLGGRTLYRVQAGAFRERTRAESVKQTMQDASLDATVSKQRR